MINYYKLDKIIERNSILTDNYNKGEKDAFLNFLDSMQEAMDLCYFILESKVKAAMRH